MVSDWVDGSPRHRGDIAAAGLDEKALCHAARNTANWQDGDGAASRIARDAVKTAVRPEIPDSGIKAPMTDGKRRSSCGLCA
jgi:hypothetical protein